MSLQYQIATSIAVVSFLMLIGVDYLWQKGIARKHSTSVTKIWDGMRDSTGKRWRYAPALIGLSISIMFGLLSLQNMPLELLLPEEVTGHVIIIRAVIFIGGISLLSWLEDRYLIRGKYSKKKLFQ